MPVNEKAIERLNSQLDILSTEGFAGFQLEEFMNDDNTELFLSVCNSLINELLHHDEIISCGSISEIFTALQEYCPPYFPLESDMIKYRIVHFMCTQIQSDRLRTRKNKPLADNKGKIAFTLDKICKELVLSTESSSTCSDILDAIQQNLETLYSDPTHYEVLHRPPKVLEHITQLNQNQEMVINQVNEAFYEDFKLRRTMLMKRLDVTIQSFMWSQKAGFDEQAIKKAIADQLQYLNTAPKVFTIQDALAAPMSLLHEQDKKITGTIQSASGSKSIVKKILIGSVPDRGGRANEVRPKKFEIGGFHGGGGNKNYNKGGRGNNKNNNGQQQQSQSGGNNGGGGGKDGNRNQNSNNQQNKKPRVDKK